MSKPTGRSPSAADVKRIRDAFWECAPYAGGCHPSQMKMLLAMMRVAVGLATVDDVV